MNILAIGDLVGDIGLRKFKENLENIREAEKIDFTIVNGENVSDGRGITVKDYNILCDLDVDVITMGNHTFGKKDIFNLLDKDNIIIPANYPEGVPGKGYTIINKMIGDRMQRICVINLLGRTNIDVKTENPFLKATSIIEEVKDKADVIIVDFHAEATAEKIALGYYLDGKVSAVFGTHTHVATADEKVLKNGTGYITDIGMTGPEESVLGMDVDVAIKRFLTSIPEKYKVADSPAKLEGVVFSINDNTKKCERIYRISI